ncbi:hypothetical protein AU106_gp110 [Sinorhizobium phage phiM9]|uniref:Uncharacterized protein n=1 Tax=Sinorhizobium phage phiM9 TaxID=1636182 RepID=A0A0F6TH44_9CAUD|nr:hypothetical protein AU106_gp110 [Sinorhizobium phage phiM9]AKE44741.1 hypothetical protein Sm_phiM9_113 [Sinorhizobium phage phiM9]
MICSAMQKTTLDIYFRLNQNKKVIVDYAFPYHFIDPAFWHALETVLRNVQVELCDDPEGVLEEVLRQFQSQIGDRIRLLMVSNSNARKA